MKQNMIKMNLKQRLLPLLLVASVSGFTPQVSRPLRHQYSAKATHLARMPQLQATAESEQEFDKMLQDAKLGQAVNYVRSNPDLELTRERFGGIFNAIESRTGEADENSIALRKEQENPLLSKTRMEMTDMYEALKGQNHLRLFGAITKDNMPASGSHTVRPELLEEITLLSMKALTPKPSNTLLWAGIGLALIEGLASAAFGLNLNILFFVTFAAAFADRIILNGAIQETVAKILAPETQPKITRHEAGHFLCAYLLGCPVEGYVLSAWAALADARFGDRGVSAGTSFFDPLLSKQIGDSKVTRSSIDRYSIIVMAGIAAEAVNYGRADGGAGDEMALIAFLSQMNGPPSANPSWNDITIRNQARWGAMQAVLILREYKECNDALVDTLERGGSLGDCIYAIEKAGRDHNKLPLKEPLGYILERSGGLEEEWVTELSQSMVEKEQGMAAATNAKTETPPMDPEQSLEALREYKQMMQKKLKDINEKLGQFE
jgi:hypothetical protein